MSTITILTREELELLVLALGWLESEAWTEYNTTKEEEAFHHALEAKLKVLIEREQA